MKIIPNIKDVLRSEMQPLRVLWVAQLVECPTLDFGSGHDLMVRAFDLASGSVLTVWSLLGILSSSLSLPLPCSLSISLFKINKLVN